MHPVYPDIGGRQLRTHIARALLLAAFVPASAVAGQDAVQSQRLVAANLSLSVTANSSALASIWQDRLRAEQAKLASLPKPPGASPAPSVPVFFATFKEGDKTIIVSTLFTTPECRNYSGVASPNLDNCPMRVAVLRGDQVKVVATADDFPFVAELKESSDSERTEYDNQSQKNKTIVMFNPATGEITTSLTLNGSLDTEKSPAIRIPTN
jgi:hypothetical protein